ncbi:MAG: 2-C-methyl-D-erythritol 2,4-cyclodiphosphate synthase [candidate division Zixibacteria bacterium]|nr:2-C-methyl-D-erythritol 2,4-cyclodiphosphate synthase [candidate division Zixibacteria bacterium]MDH3939054.1 2-C-methyl-D-erythritol 2,4-cyclodiphosphate synthase [candidate division Zixibacteria bacterium]MDH4035248.1 2-C-methyl-D-erythritol 2,4-cyclodiphosphate synthase [candidate division Zixibacteria bacterium]
MAEWRVGHGYDVHRLTAGRRLVIGGVEIEHHMGLDGHSDADVLLHAIMDALLGAAGLGDIGQHFPPSDRAYKDVVSLDLLQQVGRLVRAAGYKTIVNIDATIMAERPRMAPHVPTMRQRIAKTLSIEMSRVNIKATTTEELGFVGREEGMVAEAVCLIASDD